MSRLSIPDSYQLGQIAKYWADRFEILLQPPAEISTYSDSKPSERLFYALSGTPLLTLAVTGRHAMADEVDMIGSDHRDSSVYFYGASASGIDRTFEAVSIESPSKIVVMAYQMPERLGALAITDKKTAEVLNDLIGARTDRFGHSDIQYDMLCPIPMSPIGVAQFKDIGRVKEALEKLLR